MQGNTSLVVTVLGADRPGIVESLAQLVAAHGASWQESRMVDLAGRFAGVVRAEVPEVAAEALAADLRALASEGLQVVVDTGSPVGPEPTEQELSLSLVGNDRPGIVREISAALAKRSVNVQELRTECVSAPVSGGPLFRATARLRIPAELAAEDLRDVLEAIATDLMVDLSLDEGAETP